MAAVRFLQDVPLRILESIIDKNSGKMRNDERVMAVRQGQILQLESYDVNDDGTFNFVFSSKSSFHGTCIGVDPKVVSLFLDQTNTTFISTGCKKC